LCFVDASEAASHWVGVWACGVWVAVTRQVTEWVCGPVLSGCEWASLVTAWVGLCGMQQPVCTLTLF
jgi:hypothetical protein